MLSSPILGRGGGEMGPSITECRLGRGPPPYQVELDPASRLAATNVGWKLGAVPLSVPLSGGGAGPMWPRPRPTFVQSFVLIHPTVCRNTPTSHTGRQSRQSRQTDNGPRA